MFLLRDADLPLLLLPSQPKNAFEDKVVWITGASSGIGASLAKDFAMQGAQVVLSARRAERLENIVQECVMQGSKHAPYSLPLDVVNISEQEKTFGQLIEKFKRVDILILNAGRSQRNLAINTDVSVTKDLFELNFFSFISLAKLVLPSMIKANAGQIAIVSSLSGRIGTPIASSYSASKFALVYA
jgi:short-subunit dehydrogenase